MSRLITAAATSQTLSVAAMEEASRMGQREADLEHLLLALSLSEQAAGGILREHGLTLDVLRQAISEQRNRQIQSLGVDAPLPHEGRISFHETGGYEWTKRANDILGRSAEGNKNGDANAVLLELLDEPSGLIEELLIQLGTSPADVMHSVYESDAARPVQASPAGRNSPGHTEAFVPAAVTDIWELLADPSRMPEWDILTARVSDIPRLSPVRGDHWWSYPPATRADGKAVRVKKGSERRKVELLAIDKEASISWRFTYPDLGRSNSSALTIGLAPASGGTNLSIALTWQRSTGWRRAVGMMLTPLQKLVMWLHLRQVAGGISRVFR